MTDNIIHLPRGAELLVGPFVEYRVVVEGREIPKLTGKQFGDRVELLLDGRFLISVPESSARDVAWLVAHAMAMEVQP